MVLGSVPPSLDTSSGLPTEAYGLTKTSQNVLPPRYALGLPLRPACDRQDGWLFEFGLSFRLLARLYRGSPVRSLPSGL